MYGKVPFTVGTSFRGEEKVRETAQLRRGVGSVFGEVIGDPCRLTDGTDHRY